MKFASYVCLIRTTLVIFKIIGVGVKSHMGDIYAVS
jgi:hypothetical protein